MKTLRDKIKAIYEKEFCLTDESISEILKAVYEEFMVFHSPRFGDQSIVSAMVDEFFQEQGIETGETVEKN